MKQSLYAIEKELNNIIEAIIENGGELTPEIEQALAINEENLKEKLDNYNKALTIINNRVAVCKQEKDRINNLQKSREKAAARLKNAMFEAVFTFGQENKSGNKVIELDTAKLMTRATSICEVKESVISKLLEVVKDRLRELWNNDMISEEFDDLDEEGMLSIINHEMNVDNPGEPIVITKNDLEVLGINITVNLKLKDLFKKINYDAVNTYFNHEEVNGFVSVSTTAADYKQFMTTRNESLSIADMCKSYSLTIK